MSKRWLPWYVAAQQILSPCCTLPHSPSRCLHSAVLSWHRILPSCFHSVILHYFTLSQPCILPPQPCLTQSQPLLTIALCHPITALFHPVTAASCLMPQMNENKQGRPDAAVAALEAEKNQVWTWLRSSHSHGRSWRWTSTRRSRPSRTCTTNTRS